VTRWQLVNWVVIAGGWLDVAMVLVLTAFYGYAAACHLFGVDGFDAPIKLPSPGASNGSVPPTPGDQPGLGIPEGPREAA
jgi:hypothetical protein